MDFALDGDAEELRQRLRAFLAANHPGRAPKDPDARSDWLLGWHHLLAKQGYTGPAWPKAWGGMELSLAEQVAYHEEMTRANVPPGPSGLRIVGPTILRFGTDGQRQRHLPPMVTGDEQWCLGYSEPGAGSDLPSLRTRATRDGDEYVVNGQKVWTSHSWQSDMMAALVRTGTEASRQHGISYLLIDMTTPGITIRPLKDMAGDVRFSEVFFDDVRVPAANVVGAENDGWRVARTALGYERSTALTVERGRSTEPEIRQELARLEISVRLLRLNNLRVLSAVLRGEEPGPESSVTRLMHSLFEQQLHEFAVDMLGSNALLDGKDPLAAQRGRWAWGFLRTRGSTIGAGTAEVQRNLIAERVLGLPYDPAMPAPPDE
jgi:alkylation response protein AidB-like acyl-CoA dehydrogenase